MLPTLFNIHIDELSAQWTQNVNDGVELSPDVHIKSLLYADDYKIVEHALQTAVHQFRFASQGFGMMISCQKSRTMAFRRKWPVRSNIFRR